MPGAEYRGEGCEDCQVSALASVVVFSEHVPETIAFYRALGVPLIDEDHGDGAYHAAADLGGVHIAVLESRAFGSSQPWRSGGSTFVGFWVEALETVAAALELLGADLVVSHERQEWGCRMVFNDPDGRAVEINQRHHCPD